MSRDGFGVMDVSTDIVNDPKFRRLHRHHPEHVAVAFMVYAAVLGESWKAGQRVSVTDAWPVLLPFDEAVIGSMRTAGLLDRRGQVPVKSWSEWYGPAHDRRERSRERWRRANDKRPELSTKDNARTASIPRGNSADTASPARAPSVRPSVPSVPTVPSEEARATEDDEPEGEAVTWLALHGCYIVPGNGYHRQLIAAVEHHGINAVIGMFDRLAGAGTTDGDIKGYIFGAKDALDARTRPDLTVIVKEEERAEDKGRRAAASKRQLAELSRYIDEEPMPEEQRTANLARLRSEMAAKGLIS